MAANTSLAGQPVTASQSWYARSPGEVTSNLGVDPGTGVLLLALTVPHAVIGLRQEGKAGSAMNALKSMMKARRSAPQPSNSLAIQ